MSIRHLLGNAERAEDAEIAETSLMHLALWHLWLVHDAVPPCGSAADVEKFDSQAQPRERSHGDWEPGFRGCYADPPA